jgi:hypothetical protein
VEAVAQSTIQLFKEETGGGILHLVLHRLYSSLGVSQKYVIFIWRSCCSFGGELGIGLLRCLQLIGGQDYCPRAEVPDNPDLSQCRSVPGGTLRKPNSGVFCFEASLRY